MKAVVYDKKAAPYKLVYREIDKPVPSESEVLIKVHCVSLNAADYRSMKMGIIPKKKIFGADISGTVESAGSYVSGFKPGDEVMGDLGGFGFGGMAEYVSTPGKALIKKPSGITFDEAAAIPMASMTALQALRNKGKIRQGMKVLIVGSSGGVGTYAIQLAKHFGAEVTGVCSTRNLEQTLSLGADHAIDYTKEDFYKGDKKYDIVLGINGNYPLLSYRKSLSGNGIYVMIGGSLQQIFKSLVFGWFLSLGSRKMKSLAAKADNYDLKYVADLVEKRIIRTVTDRFYTLEKGPEAMEYLSQGHTTGKVIIRI
jgi:NADPH:quinone reductase-like Zn-dependent oxidoreductase